MPLFCLLMMLGACGGGSDPVDPIPSGSVASISVSVASGSIPVFGEVTVVATPKDASGNTVSASISWRVSDEAVASISPSGVLTGRSPGTATVTATSGTISGSATIAVNSADLADIVEQFRSTHGLPGMGGAVVTLDGVIALGVSGERRVGGPSVTLQDQWHIGSNLKAVTGYLAGIAVDAGVIDWTTTVSEVFTEVTVRQEYQAVTLRDLVTNQSGLPGSPTGATLTSSDPRDQRNAVAATAFQLDPVVPRGTYAYSNVGFAMAGAMLERAWDTTYEAALRSYFFEPAGVVGEGWGPQTAPGASDNPVPHSWNGSGWSPCEGCDNPPWLSAAGRMHVPLEGWGRMISEMLKGDEGTSALVSAGTGRTLMEGAVPVGGTDQYGYGWVVTSRPWASGRTVTHSGSNTINHSVVWVAPERNFAVLALTNAADLSGGRSGQALDALVGRLIQFYETGN